MGKLAEAFKHYFQDAMPGGALNPEITPSALTKLAGTLMDFAPVISGMKGAHEEWQAGNHGMAALNAASVPLDIASLGTSSLFKAGMSKLLAPMALGVIKDIPKPAWNMARRGNSMPVAVWDDGKMVKSEAAMLFRDPQSKSAYDTLRTLTDKGSGTVYAWPADAALHQDVGAFFKIDPNNAKHGILIP